MAKKRIINDYTAEYKSWKSEFRAAVRKHGEEFWEIQTEVENDWIESYNKALLLKSEKKAVQYREAVIKIAKNTIDLQNKREENAKRLESNKRLKEQEYADEFFRKKLLMDTLNLESTRWITLENYSKLIKENLLLPHNLKFSSYYVKLQRESEIAGLGKIVSKKDFYNNRKESNIKNYFLLEYFTDVKSLIRHLTYTPLQPLFEDFEAVKAKLFDYPDKIREIAKKYKEVAAAWKNKEKINTEIYLIRLLAQLKLVSQLSIKWNEYIEIAKMDDVEIALLNSGLKSEEKFEDNSDVESDDWNDDFEAANPETSDAYEDVKINKDEFEEALKFDDEENKNEEVEEQEEGEYNAKFDTDTEPATDFDMYKGEVTEAPIKNEKLIDNVIDELLKEMNKSEELFKSKETISSADIYEKAKQEDYSPIASLITIREKVESIDDKSLDLQNKARKYDILDLIEKLENTKVDEPHMLLKVYLHHRYEPPVFS